MTAAILSIGTELTRGELINSNAAWLADRLTLLGFEVLEHATVDDDVPRIVETLTRLGSRYRVVVSTGGLGPTTDDLTTEAVAKTLGVGLHRDSASLDHIRDRLARFGRPMSSTNEKQADFPEGADILPNEMGTAPGFAVQLEAARAFFLPGVPTEMKHIFERRIESELAALAGRNSFQIRLRTFGLPESVVGEKLAGLEEEEAGLTIGYRASFPEIEVKVRVRGGSLSDAQSRAVRCAAKVRERLGSVVYGEGEDTYAACVGRELKDRGLTLAVGESCTGGMIGAMITSVPGSSEYLRMGAVTYSNASKHDLLGVDLELIRACGAVSEQVAVAMAQGALRRADSDLAVAVTGIAGPGGGSDDKPVGTVWIAVAQREGSSVVKRYSFPGDRERIRTMASYVALKMIAEGARSMRAR
jgi:nicotinamide-nucleotide amidase